MLLAFTGVWHDGRDSLIFSAMKFPLFSQAERSLAAARERQEQAEKLLAESLRLLGGLCQKLADAVESQRLSRSGYEQQGKFLERIDPAEKK